MVGSVFDNETGQKCARLLSSAASDNATNAVSRPCALKGIQGFNNKAAAVFLKLYDETSVPLAADTPVKTIYLPASAAFALDFPDGFMFANGMGYRLTGAVADADATAIAAGDILALNLDYV